MHIRNLTVAALFAIFPVHGRMISSERASYNGSIEASQASDVGSIPIARSITHDVSIALTRLTYLNPA